VVVVLDPFVSGVSNSGGTSVVSAVVVSGFIGVVPFGFEWVRVGVVHGILWPSSIASI